VHNNGFEIADPLASTSAIGPFPVNTNVTDWGPADQGAYFLLSFGDLAPGEVKRFSLFYGAAYDEATAMSMLTSVGAEVYSLAQPATNLTGNTFILAFKGVGGTPLGEQPVIPEPGTWALMLSGLVPVALRLRKRS
ncbi:MAG: PEP-CTERM sorting domain-containing protein, partial [bacterium]|nr:PEP-CTERM sorting domain-containing protein [bacterium]